MLVLAAYGHQIGWISERFQETKKELDLTNVICNTIVKIVICVTISYQFNLYYFLENLKERNVNKAIIIYLLYHSLCWCLCVHQPGAHHAPGASDTQVTHSDHTLSTFLRIRADPSMLICWVSVTLALSDTFLMFSTIPFFIVPSASTIQRDHFSFHLPHSLYF